MRMSKPALNLSTNFHLFHIRNRSETWNPLSALLFVFFINDIVQKVASNDDQNSISLHDVNQFMLLYADDAVLFGKSPQLLQQMLNNLHEYSISWDLNVNTEKTKIMIFENGRKTTTMFRYGDVPLKMSIILNI